MVDIEIANVTPTGTWDMTGGDVKVPAPSADTDASTKKYVDDEVGGVPAGVDWTADQSPAVINAANYTDTGDTTYVAGDFAHNDLADLNDGTDYEHITQAQKDALHAIYTDASAVAAVATADDYLKNDGDTGTGDYTFNMTDNTADIFTIAQGANHYMCCDTTNGSENVVFGCGAVPTILTVEATLVSTEVNLDVDGDIAVSGTVDGIDIATDVAANTGKNTNVTTDLSVTKNATTMTVVSSDGDNGVLVEADTTNAGILGSDKWDEIVANSNKDTNVSTNLSMGTVDGTQFNINSSDGNNVALTLSTTDNWGIMSDEMFDQLALAVTHYGDNTQAHSDYLLNSGADVAVGPLTTTADNSTADQAYVPMVLYNTDDTPPAASGFPVGTIYVQYTA